MKRYTSLPTGSVDGKISFFINKNAFIFQQLANSEIFIFVWQLLQLIFVQICKSSRIEYDSSLMISICRIPYDN